MERKFQSEASYFCKNGIEGGFKKFKLQRLKMLKKLKQKLKKPLALETYEDILIKILKFLIRRNPISLIYASIKVFKNRLDSRLRGNDNSFSAHCRYFSTHHPFVSALGSFLFLFLLVAGVFYFAFNSNIRGAKADWLDEDWKFRKRIYFNNQDQTENLIDFPVMVKLDSDSFDFSSAQSTGADLRFTDSDGETQLNYEFENYNSTNQEAIVWVKIPQVNGSSNEDSIFMYWGNSSVSDAQDVDGTWSSAYKGVWHFNQDSDSVTEFSDSSGNSNDLGVLTSTDQYVKEAGYIGKSYISAGSPHQIANQEGSISELYPDIILDANDYPVIAFFDDTDNDLMVMHCSDPECKNGSEVLERVDYANDTGYYPVIQLDSNGYPMIAYWDNTLDDLKYVHCNDANCSGGDETIVTLDSAGDTGRFAEIELDSSGMPVIAYFNNTNDDVKVVHCDDLNCSTFSINTVDTQANCYTMNSIGLKLDSNDFPVISYFDNTNNELKLTHCNDVDCAGGDESIQVVVANGNDHYYTDLELDKINGYPMITYHDETIDDLFYIHCDDVNCVGTETIKTITTGDAQYPVIQLNSAGVPIIIAEYSVYPRMFVCNDVDCTTDSETYITVYEQYGFDYPTFVLDSNDYPVIAGHVRGRSGNYDIDIHRLTPKTHQDYDADFNFGSGDFSASMWFKSDGEASNDYLLSRYDYDQGFKIYTDYGGHLCFGIDDDSSFGPDDSACTLPSDTTRNADGGKAGGMSNSSMKLDNNGYPVVAYYDSTPDDLEIIHCTDANCSGTKNHAVLDTPGDMGRTPALALDSNGIPAVAYHDNTNQDLKFVKCGDVDCSSGNTTVTLDSNGTVGDYASIVLDSNDYPVIGYYDATNTAVKLVHCNDVACQGGDESVVTVDNTEIDRPYVSQEWLQLDPNDYPVMAYYNDTTDDLKLAHCNDVDCAGGDETITVVETSGYIGRYASMELDTDGYPVIATHRTSFDLKLIHCNDANCVSKTSNYIEDPENSDKGYNYIDLELNSSGFPVISHTSLTNWSYYITTCNDVDCAGNDEVFSKVRDNSSHGSSSLELDSNDHPVFAYYDGADLNLLHSSTEIYQDTGRYDDQEWHQLVAVKNGTSAMYLYVDGVQVASNTSIIGGSLSSDSASLRLAETLINTAGRDYSRYNWSGDIDELQIDNTARTADWVAAQYLSESDNFLSFGSYTETSPKFENPVGYWSFDEGQGTIAHDDSGEGNDGSFLSAPVWKNDDFCVSGKCLAFDNVDDGISIAGENFDSLEDYTMCSWVNPKGNHKHYTGTIMSSGDWNNTHWAFGLSQDNTKIQSRKADGVNSPSWNYSFVLNKWTYVCMARSGGVITAYANGNQVGNSYTGVTGNLVSGATNTTIGRETYASGYFAFNGWIDEPKIYDYARTKDQISQDYNAGLTGIKSVQGSSVIVGQKSSSWLTDGLVGYWKMDEDGWDGTSGEVMDSSGNGNNGTAGGEATTSAGKFGNSGSFNGSDNRIDTSYGDDYDLGSNDLTLSFWVKPESITGDQMFASFGTNVDNKRAYFGKQAGSWDMGIQSSGWGGVDAGAVSTEWNNIVIVFDKTTLVSTMYVNGEYGMQKTYTNYELLGNLKIGVYGNNAYDWFGQIDEVRIYEKALSLDEVKGLYQYAPGPVLHLKMDEKSGTTAFDTSGNENNGTLTNMDSSTDWTRGKYGSALDFDGDNDYVRNNTLGLGADPIFTVSAWIKKNGNMNNTGAWGIGEGGTSLQTISGYCSNSEKIGIDLWGVATFSTDYDYPQDEWVYATWVKKATLFSTDTIDIYVNGEKQDLSIIRGASHTPNLTDGFTIGGIQPSSLYSANAQIDDFKIYNYARTQKQILEDMNAGSANKSSFINSSFDEGFGDVVHNSGVSDINGTLCNGTSWDQEGKIKKALNFDGLNDYAIFSDNSLFDYTGEDKTFLFWVKVDSGEGGNKIISKPWNGAGEYNYGFQWNGSGISLNLEGAGGSQSFATSTSMNVENWYHVGLTIDSETKIRTFYINGKKDNSSAHTISSWVPDNGDSNLPLTIGTLYPYNCSSWAGNTGHAFDGMIDELKIYNYTLTEDEIKEEYNQGSTVVFGSTGTESDGVTPSYSSSRKYCVPGDTSTCDPPIAEWKFDEKEGITVYDVSGNDREGTLVSPTWTRGKYGSALDFNGSVDYVSLPRFAHSSSGVSLGAWVKTTSTDSAKNYSGNAAQNVLGDNTNGVGLGFGLTGGKIEYSHYNSSWNHVIGLSDVNDGKWHYISVTHDSNSEVKLYLDGKLDNTGSITLTSARGINRIGGGYQNYVEDTTGDEFDGQIDNVVVYNYARTPAQIAWDYNKGGPVAQWRFDEGEGSTIHDESGNGNDGVVENMDPVDWASGKKNTALNFEGGVTNKGHVDLDSSYVIDLTSSTVAFWGKRDVLDVTQDATNTNGALRILYGTGSLKFLDQQVNDTYFQFNAERDVNSEYWARITSSVVADTEWHHFLITADDNVFKLYIDGIYQGMDDDSSAGYISNTCTITDIAKGYNAAHASYGSYYDGKLDDIRIYNYPLTEQQIKQVYSEGF